MDVRTALLKTLARLSFRLGNVTLSSGQLSDYYIDCRTTTLDAEGGRLAGIVMLDLLRTHFASAEAIGGLTMGADPLVSNIASASAWEVADHREFLILAPEEEHGREPTLVHGFLVRKAEKTYGIRNLIEGFKKVGASVVIVDDVCTTGGSTILAIEAARDSGMTVLGALCLVDREQGGRALIEQSLKGGQFISAFTAEEVRATHARIPR